MKWIISLICGSTLGILTALILKELNFDDFTQGVWAGVMAVTINRIVENYIENKKNL